MGAEKGKGGRNWAAFCRAGAVAFYSTSRNTRRVGRGRNNSGNSPRKHNVHLSALLLRVVTHMANHVGRARVRVALSPLLSAAAPSVTRVH